MTRCIFLLVAAQLLAATGPAHADATNTANRTSAVGMNLGRNYYYAPELPFLNVLRKAIPWRESPPGAPGCGAADRDYTGTLDANGYPTNLGDRTCAYTRMLGAEHSVAGWPLGEWVLRFDGTGTFGVRGAGSGLGVAGNRGTFTVDASTGGLFLEIHSTSPGNPARNVRLYPPGGICAASPNPPYDLEPWAYCSNDRCAGGTCVEAEPCGGERPYCVDLEDAAEAGGATFHPLWLARLRGYRTLRFMDWQHTNRSHVVDYADWTSESFYSWAYRNHQVGPGGQANPGAVPPEVAADLCATLNAECWLNVPHMATDAHVLELSRMLRDRIPAHLPVHLEYSNEVWNGLFDQHQWTIDAAVSLPDSVFDPTGCDASGSLSCSDSFYGKRTFEMCQIAQQAFDETGQGDRLVCVLARHSADPGKLRRSLDCSRWLTAPGGNCYAQSDIDAVAIAPYFGDADDCAAANSIDDLLDDMAEDIDLEYALGPPGIRTFVRNQFDVLADRGLDWPLLAYEGGSHQSDSNTLCYDAFVSPGIRTAYIDALNAWEAHASSAGRDIRTYVAFNSITEYRPGGSLFGARGSWLGPRGTWPKEDGLLDWAEAPGNACGWDDCTLAAPGLVACGNGLDDDGDGFADLADLGCNSSSDTSERAGWLECDNGLDDDGDGAADYPLDPGCRSGIHPTESPECSNGVNDDGDAWLDAADPGCAGPDGLTESPQCNDGLDNDGDGATDLADPQCLRASQRDESRRGCGLGFEVGPVLWLLLSARGRRAERG